MTKSKTYQRPFLGAVFNFERPQPHTARGGLKIRFHRTVGCDLLVTKNKNLSFLLSDKQGGLPSRREIVHLSHKKETAALGGVTESGG